MNYILRFPTEKQATDCIKHFPVKAELTAYCIMLKSLTAMEAMIYIEIIRLVEYKYKLNLTVSKF